jgi:hypothetical protein
MVAQFDLVLQLAFSPEAPCVPPVVTLCKGLLELPFVAPFYPRPSDAARPTDDGHLPTSARSRSSSLLAAIRPAMAARARSGSSEKWTLPIDKALPPVPPQHSSQAQAGPSGSGIPDEFAVVAEKYDLASAAARAGAPDVEATRPGPEDEAPPPAYDGRRADG